MKINKITKLSILMLFILIISYLAIVKINWYSNNQLNKKVFNTKIVNLEEYAAKTIENERLIDMRQFTKKKLNIPYTKNDIVHQKLDIIYPSQGKPPYKTIVVFHGGGWRGGDKESEKIASVFQATTQGYAIVATNYRLSYEVFWPKPLFDAKAVIRFLRANATKYKLDTKKIVVWGASAGGHIVEMLAATNHEPAFEDFSMGNKYASSAVQGVVAWYGVADLRTLTKAGTPAADKIMGFDVKAHKSRTYYADPINLLNKNFPPILLVHGTYDKTVPYVQSLFMEKKVNMVTGKRTAFLITFYGAAHGDAIIKTKENVARYLDFVDKILYDGKNPYRNTNYLNIRILK
jgi:acetyl esterase/lipase